MTDLSDEDVETIKEIISDWGSDCPVTDYKRVRLLAEKLGLWEPEPEPTPEELAEREAFRNSPFAIEMRRLFATANSYQERVAADLLKDSEFAGSSNASGVYQWPVKIETQLKIKLSSEV